jgi:two-component system, response regulator
MDDHLPVAETGLSAELVLIEDDPADAELILRALRRDHARIRLQHFADGEEALNVLLGREPHARRHQGALPRVVVLDLKLPQVDGLAILRALKADPRTQLIPVVIFTSSAETQDIVACHRLGASSYLVKPIDAELFEQTIRQAGNYWLRLNHTPA